MRAIVREAQETRQGMEKETAIADMQKEIVKSAQGVEIAQRNAEANVKKAEGEAGAIKLKAAAEAEATKLTAAAEAEKIKLTGNAEAEKILAIGKSTAEAYEKQVAAMGKEEFTSMQITKLISEGKVQLVPQIVGGGNGGGNTESFMGLMLLNQMGVKLPGMNQGSTPKKEEPKKEEKK
jgi:uncharacterized membrane protein YqiK